MQKKENREKSQGIRTSGAKSYKDDDPKTKEYSFKHRKAQLTN